MAIQKLCVNKMRCPCDKYFDYRSDQIVIKNENYDYDNRQTIENYYAINGMHDKIDDPIYVSLAQNTINISKNSNTSKQNKRNYLRIWLTYHSDAAEDEYYDNVFNEYLSLINGSRGCINDVATVFFYGMGEEVDNNYYKFYYRSTTLDYANMLKMKIISFNKVEDFCDNVSWYLNNSDNKFTKSDFYYGMSNEVQVGVII